MAPSEAMSEEFFGAPSYSSFIIKNSVMEAACSVRLSFFTPRSASFSWCHCLISQQLPVSASRCNILAFNILNRSRMCFPVAHHESAIADVLNHVHAC